MWHKLLERNIFISELYINVPQLIDVRVSEFKILDEGYEVVIIFDMPYYADNPPVKWINRGFNTVSVRVDFFCIKNITLESLNNRHKANIEMIRSKDDTIIVFIEGSINVKIEAKSAIIQYIKGYCNKM